MINKMKLKNSEAQESLFEDFKMILAAIKAHIDNRIVP